MSTFWCRAWSALRTLVSISATGSVNLIVCFSSRHPFAPHSAENLQRLARLLVVSRWWLANAPTNDCSQDAPATKLVRLGQRLTTYYHDDFAKPGISPRSARSRKHKRHRPNLRR